MRFLLFLIALLVLIPKTHSQDAFKFDDLPFLASPVTAAASPCDSCTGNLLFSWHCENDDVTLGTPCGCSVGDTTGTAASGAVLSTDQKQDGTYSLSIPTVSDYYGFTWASSDILNPNAGTIDFWFRYAYITAGTPIYFWVDVNNRIYVNPDVSNTYLAATHISGGTISSGRTGVSVVTSNTWYHAKIRWDTTAHSGLYLKVTCDTTTGESNDAGQGTNPLGTWAGTSGTLNIGDYLGNGGSFYVDNIKIYNNWQ